MKYAAYFSYTIIQYNSNFPLQKYARNKPNVCRASLELESLDCVKNRQCKYELLSLSGSGNYIHCIIGYKDLKGYGVGIKG